MGVLAQQMLALSNERDSLAQQMLALSDERDSLAQQMLAVSNERDSTLADINLIKSSSSWKITKPLRFLFSIPRKLKKRMF
jgi:hypothetical protein